MQPPSYSGVDMYRVLRGERVNYITKTKNRRQVDTDGEESTALQSDNQNTSLLDAINRSQSVKHEQTSAHNILSQRKKQTHFLRDLRRTEQLAEECARRVVNLRKNQLEAMRRVEIANRRAISLMKVREQKRIGLLRVSHD